MIWCWLFGHNYTRPSWGTELVRGTNPFCYRCGRPPKDIYAMNDELLKMNQELMKMLKEKENDIRPITTSKH